jgi:hypothetical protein
MSLLRYWKIALGLALVFGAGAITGSVATHHLIKHHVEHTLNFDNWKAGVMHVLQSKLQLTPQQHQKVEVLVDERGKEIRASFTQAFDESGHALVRLQGQIDQELTPNQRQIHDQMKRDFRAELKKRFNYDLPEK